MGGKIKKLLVERKCKKCEGGKKLRNLLKNIDVKNVSTSMKRIKCRKAEKFALN